MPHDRSSLIDQLRALLTLQDNSVVIHNHWGGAEHFHEYLARRDIAVESATPAHVSGYLHYAMCFSGYRRYRDDRQLIIHAAAQVQKSVDYILNRPPSCD